jgi:two-component system response regulator NreC
MLPVNILLINRHTAFAASMVAYLTLYSELKVVAIARDGERGLRAAEALWLDMILVDLDPRGIGRASSGLATIRHLRASLPGAGIIAMSLHDHNGYQQAALLAGADDFVLKTRMTEDLVPTIQRVMQSRLTGSGD